MHLPKTKHQAPLGRCVWGLRPSWYKPGSGEVLGGAWARVPQREAGLCILEKGSLLHFEVANESTDASLIYPESCPRRNSTWAMNSSRKHPFSLEQNVQLREPLWSAERGRQPWDGGWVPQAPAEAVELGVYGPLATAQGLPSGGGGGWPPRRPVIHGAVRSLQLGVEGSLGGGATGHQAIKGALQPVASFSRGGQEQEAARSGPALSIRKRSRSD